MNKIIFSLLLSLSLLSMLSGCAAQPSVDTAATQAAIDGIARQTAAAVTAEAASAATAESASATASAEAAAEAAAASAAETQAAQATVDAAAAATATQSAKRTATVEAEKAAEATSVALATQQASSMAEAATQLYTEGIIASDGGEYHAYDDFDESWAQIGWYNYWTFDIAPTNFIIRAHTEWEMATRIPDPSGCGFVFRINDAGDHFMVFLQNNGKAYMHMVKKDIYTRLGEKYAAKVDPIKGEADVMLVVEGKQFSYYVNGTRVLRVENQNLPEGQLGLTLISGTNKDFGTRCKMTGIEIWDMDE